MRENGAVLDLGRIDYQRAWDFQLDLVEKRARGDIADTLLLAEHEPVYTFGRSVKAGIPPGLPFPGYAIERGGKATYHGPGQLVLYPIMKLPGPMILRFIRALEQWIIDLLSEFELSACQKAGETGVWIGQRKVASIGIAVKHWVTFHGASLNIDPDLSHFQAIQPCGYSPEVITSVSRETSRAITVAEVKTHILARKKFSVPRNRDEANVKLTHQTQ